MLQALVRRYVRDPPTDPRVPEFLHASQDERRRDRGGIHRAPPTTDSRYQTEKVDVTCWWPPFSSSTSSWKRSVLRSTGSSVMQNRTASSVEEALACSCRRQEGSAITLP